MSSSSRYTQFNGKIVLITGAGSGIGRALSLALAEAGAVVYSLDINEDDVTGLMQVRSDINGLVLDVTDAEAFQQCADDIVSERGRIDYLFNNAGVTLLGDTNNISYQDWKTLLDVNVLGVCHGIAAVYPQMIKQGNGHIINTASIAAVTGYASAVPYTCSKAFVVGITRSLMPEARRYNVSISVVFPGYVKTKIFTRDRVIGADPDEVFSEMPFKAISSERAADYILSGTLRKKKKIIFPLSAKLLWTLGHLTPALLRPFHAKFLKPFRQSK